MCFLWCSEIKGLRLKCGWCRNTALRSELLLDHQHEQTNVPEVHVIVLWRDTNIPHPLPNATSGVCHMATWTGVPSQRAAGGGRRPASTAVCGRGCTTSDWHCHDKITANCYSRGWQSVLHTPFLHCFMMCKALSHLTPLNYFVIWALFPMTSLTQWTWIWANSERW